MMMMMMMAAGKTCSERSVSQSGMMPTTYSTADFIPFGGGGGGGGGGVGEKVGNLLP